LTTDPPDDIDALRSTSSLGHRALPERGRWRGRAALLLFAVTGIVAVTVWQMGLLESILSPTPNVQAALNHAGLGTIAATVDGDSVTLMGTAQSHGIIDQAAAVALSVDGIRQLDNQVSVLATEGVATLADQIQDALAAAGFGGLTVAVDGDMATVGGFVPDEASLSAAALAVLEVPGVAQLDNRLEIGSDEAATDLETALAVALTADEFAYVRVEVQDRLAILQGAVPTVEARSQVVAAARQIEGIDKIDNRLEVDADLPIGPTLPPEQLEAAAGEALGGAGIQTVAISVEGRRAVLDGTVPLETLGAGFFAFVELAETAVLSVDGIDEVSSRLTLRGDGALLKGELQALLEATPVEFDLGSYELTSESQTVLDQVALIIQSQPGLQVIIAGHTDTAGSNETNEALSRQRAGAVLGYLLTRGVPSYRLVAVSYGELFPDQEASAEQNRRIEFEVGS
jgi:outer membrane protein OmpA-like peptidoglycan-associated protein